MRHLLLPSPWSCGTPTISRAGVQQLSREYQYHLKDHLGNVRFTFTSNPEVQSPEATMEPGLAEDERSEFINYDKVTKIQSDL